MVAEEIRRAFLKSMGAALDLLRVSDIGERQLRQMETSLKNQFNSNLISLLNKLEEAKLIRKCECLTEILKAKESGASSAKMQDLYKKKKLCRKCHGSGYLDNFEER